MAGSMHCGSQVPRAAELILHHSRRTGSGTEENLLRRDGAKKHTGNCHRGAFWWRGQGILLRSVCFVAEASHFKKMVQFSDQTMPQTLAWTHVRTGSPPKNLVMSWASATPKTWSCPLRWEPTCSTASGPPEPLYVVPYSHHPTLISSSPPNATMKKKF